MSTSPRKKHTSRERITHVVEGWFISEPLLFSAWTLHDVVIEPRIETIRVQHGRIEYNPAFIDSLRKHELRSVLTFEAMRILLGHPYDRRQPRTELSYMASNLSVQECLRSDLPIDRARQVFGDEQFDDQYFEFYYQELLQRQQSDEDSDPGQSDDDESQSRSKSPSTNSQDEQQHETPDDDSVADDASAAADEGHRSGETGSSAPESSESASQRTSSDSLLQAYADPTRVGQENADGWESDDLFQNEVQTTIREAAETDGWGTIAGSAKEKILSTLEPIVDYRAILRSFRQSVLSVNRRLTRMKPSRRYGFTQMGSRYDFTTKLLFAVDVSGSMGAKDLRLGFSIVGRFFQYGVESIDVLWFDEQIRSEPMTLRRARNQFEVIGRGGTNFQPLMDYIDDHRGYDGLLVFTDGYAPVPTKPKNSKTRILWLFKDESTYQAMDPSLRSIGKAAYVRPTKSKPAASRS
ncbi:DUF2201 family putative metallopeptidase [Roseiconus lacunae]|uniref:VWA-like domain-containing protein n=1 Tax=Roseiconus lacunae TaxID=2605694 RepID=A0ABT7PEC1_9BACT|nr:VWA-like domain-containing protein [Roseiconus lacunae]MDM4014826.1 VWA-like domain-containing protein [Roseiconus lacunae]